MNCAVAVARPVVPPAGGDFCTRASKYQREVQHSDLTRATCRTAQRSSRGMSRAAFHSGRLIETELALGDHATSRSRKTGQVDTPC